jgi:hypothetical protein
MEIFHPNAMKVATPLIFCVTIGHSSFLSDGGAHTFRLNEQVLNKNTFIQ